MKLSILSSLALFSSLFVVGVHGQETMQAQDTIVDKSTGLSFPREVTFDVNGKAYQLQATGVATRKKLIIKVYSIASYMQKGNSAAAGDKFDRILSDENVKQLTMKYVREVTPTQIKDAYLDSFKRVFPGQQYAQMQPDITNFLQLFAQPLHKGDETSIRWVPGGYVEVLFNDKKVGSVNNAAFAKGLWNIWFGNNSIVDRNDLVSQMK